MKVLTSALGSSEVTAHTGNGVLNHRYDYLDNLRAFAMLLGVLLHAAMPYSEFFASIYFIVDGDKSSVLQELVWLSHSFRMPLFFLIAGFFAHLLIRKRGLRGFVKNRLMRIGLPFLIFWPLCMVAMVGVFVYAATELNNRNPLLDHVMSSLQNPAAAEPQPPLTAHLWFLYYLLMFYLLTVLGLRVSVLSALGRYVCSPVFLLLALPLLLCLPMLSQRQPFAVPQSFIPNLWGLCFFGGFYWLGWHFFARQSMLDALRKYWAAMLVCCMLAYIVLSASIPDSISLEYAMAMADTQPVFSFQHLLVSLCATVLAVYLSLLLMMLAREKFDTHHPLVRFLADASYWIYLIHLPLLYLIQAHLFNVHWPAELEFLFSVLLTFIVGSLTYLLFVRWTPLGWMLNGRKPFVSFWRAKSA